MCQQQNWPWKKGGGTNPPTPQPQEARCSQVGEHKRGRQKKARDQLPNRHSWPNLSQNQCSRRPTPYLAPPPQLATLNVWGWAVRSGGWGESGPTYRGNAQRSLQHPKKMPLEEREGVGGVGRVGKENIIMHSWFPWGGGRIRMCIHTFGENNDH